MTRYMYLQPKKKERITGYTQVSFPALPIVSFPALPIVSCSISWRATKAGRENEARYSLVIILSRRSKKTHRGSLRLGCMHGTETIQRKSENAYLPLEYCRRARTKERYLMTGCMRGKRISCLSAGFLLSWVYHRMAVRCRRRTGQQCRAVSSSFCFLQKTIRRVHFLLWETLLYGITCQPIVAPTFMVGQSPTPQHNTTRCGGQLCIPLALS